MQAIQSICAETLVYIEVVRSSAQGVGPHETIPISSVFPFTLDISGPPESP